jgi:hypothetical protein
MQNWERAREGTQDANTSDFANNDLYNDLHWNAGNTFGTQNNTRAKPFSGSVDGLIH